jgi:hypothetical protein
MPLSEMQATLRSLTIGAGTSYPGIGGTRGVYGAPEPDAGETPRASGHGVTASLERLGRRIVRIPVIIIGTDGPSAAAMTDTLKAAWAPSDADLELALRLDGDERRFFGRPRGVDDSRMSGIQGRGGVIEVACTFVATDPLAYDSAVAVGADSSSPVVLTNLGDMHSRRVTLTVVGNGGTPVITNTTTGGVITFTSTVSAMETATIDLRDQSVTIAAAHVENRTSPASTWFGLDPGANTITFTGCASVAASVRSAWL